MKKNFLILAAALAVLAAPYQAKAYDSASGYDPNVTVPNSGSGAQGTIDVEVKSVILDQTASWNDQVAAGQALYYSQSTAGSPGLELVSARFVAGPATSTKAGAGSDTAAVSAFQACIVPANAYTDVGSGSSTKFAGIATGYSAAFRCIVRGYATALYDFSAFPADWSIGLGGELCISTQATAIGKLVPCSGAVRSHIIGLENKAGGTKGSIKVRVSSD